MPVKQLPHGIIRLISSTQVISSITSVVKELIENAVDAEATVVDIKLEKYGLEKIEVRDNGHGINSSDISLVCQPNHTSKISSMEDLESLGSYGFRGEALNSICAVSQLTITTRTETDEIASVYTFDCNGTVREVRPSHQMKGTTITVTNLFKNVPVRKQFFENTRKATEELKKIEKIVKILSVIHPKLKMTISHNKCLIWHKTAVTTLKQSLSQMYPHVVLKNLEYFSRSVDNISLEILICKRDCNWSVMCQPVSEAVLFFINRRPVKDKKVEKVVLEEMLYLFQSALPSNKCPLTLISLTIPPQELDVNLEPDKTKVFMKNHEEVLKHIRECIMLHFYKQPVREDRSETEQVNTALNEENPPKRPKFDSEHRRNTHTHESKLKEIQNVPSTVVTNEGVNFSFDEFENNDMNALEDILRQSEELIEKHTEESVERSTYTNSESSTIQQKSMNINSEDTDVNFEFGATTSNSVSLQLSIDDSGSSASISSIEELTKESKSSECAIVETSPDPKIRLSMSGNLVDDLFQSQIADDEEIRLENFSDHAPKSEIYADKSSTLNREFTSSEDKSRNISSNVVKVEQYSVSKREQSFPNSSASGSALNSSANEVQLDKKASNLTQTTLSQWSRGHVSIDNQPLKGISVQHGLNKDGCQRVSNRTHETDIISNQSPSPLERSVSSQMGRKDLAGLTNFAKTARLELIEKNPGMSFARVASELAKQWRGLDESKKNEYADKAKIKKNQKMAPAELTKSKPLIKNQKLVCSTSIDAIKTRLSKFKSWKKADVRIIKAFESENMYLCRIVQAIVLVSVHNLQKNVLYHRYLCYSSLPSRPVVEPLKITEELIGHEYWVFLLSLDKSDITNSTFNITDPRILKNGFQIITMDISGSTEIHLTGVAEKLEGDLMKELRQTLQLAVLYEDVRLCRSDSIKAILHRKASETCSMENICGDDVEALLEYWVQRMDQENIYSSDNPETERREKLETSVDSILRSHLEFVRDSLLVSNPVPKTVDELQRFSGMELESSVKLELTGIIAGKLVPRVVWPKNFDESMKTSVKDRISIRFREWYWITTMSDAQFIGDIREELKCRKISPYIFCSGIASLYVYESTILHIQASQYSAVELIDALNRKIHYVLVIDAAKILLTHTWVDFGKK